MTIFLKNKHTLQIDDFKFRCSIGKNGITTKKKEGDKKTPRGFYSLGNLYYRPDRLPKPNTKLKIRKIKKNMGWCDDPVSKKYNRLIKTSNKIKHEKLYRRDNKYDILIELDYNLKKIIPFAGSAIFLHLTKNYKPTAGCIAINLNDMKILIKILDKNNLIEIS